MRTLGSCSYAKQFMVAAGLYAGTWVLDCSFIMSALMTPECIGMYISIYICIYVKKIHKIWKKNQSRLAAMLWPCLQQEI